MNSYICRLKNIIIIQTIFLKRGITTVLFCFPPYYVANEMPSLGPAGHCLIIISLKLYFFKQHIFRDPGGGFKRAVQQQGTRNWKMVSFIRYIIITISIGYLSDDYIIGLVNFGKRLSFGSQISRSFYVALHRSYFQVSSPVKFC